MIYIAFVYPYLTHGIEIYGNTYMTHLNRLMKVNNRILRVLQKASPDTPVLQLYKKCNFASA